MAAQAAPGTGGLPAGDWDDDRVERAGLAVRPVEVVSVGAGLGSLALVDLQRIRGRAIGELAVVGEDPDPSAAFRRWAEASQLSGSARLRSDSASRIDNPWGWPGYAASESHRRHTPGPLVRSVAEPLFGVRYAPVADDVYRGVRREAERIGWASMLVRGRALAVRRRRGGGFFVVVQAARHDPNGSGDPSGLAVLRCRAVHLAPGHGGPVVPADAAAALAAHPEWGGRVVQAYRPHEDLYRSLPPGAVVVLRGGGIAAEQVLRRLLAERRRRDGRLSVVHVPHRPDSALEPVERLEVRRGPYSAPRSAFGGPLHARLARRSGRDRADGLMEEVRRATTPMPRALAQELDRGRRLGWYRPALSAEIQPEATGEPGAGAGEAPVPVAVDGGDGRRCQLVHAVIDCTGLEGPVGRSALVADVAAWLPGSRVTVDGSFAVAGSRNGPGALYASGALAGDGPVGPVDSFWGLAYAAYAISQDLASRGVGPTMGPLASAAAWWRWLRASAP